MKARKRVTTAGATGSRPARASDRPRRTPTVRTVRSAIVPVDRRPRPPNGGAPQSPGRAASAAEDRGPAVDLSVDLAPGRGGLRLENPVLVAAGTFGYGVEYGEVVDIQRIGAICSRGTTLQPRVGNAPPRVTETPAGLLSSVGLQNPGVEAVLERYAATWAGWRVPVIVNIAGGSIEDYVAVARRLDGVPGVAGIELNLSCPNVARGGLLFGIDREGAAAVTAAVRRATELPLMVKVSPNVADVRPIALAIEASGADVISAINTLPGMALGPDRTGPFLGTGYGGLSGPAIRPVALRIVHEVAQVVSIPIVAIGGVTELADVLDYLAAGAVAVQVGTAIFADPALPVRLADELAAECRRRDLASYRPLVGTALPRRPGAPSARGVEYRP